MGEKKKNKKNNTISENLKNTTKYGEQVCSEFEWLPIEKQKENAEKFSKITKKK